MKKRLIALTLICSLACTVLGGCGTKEPDETPINENAETEGKNTEPEDSPAVGMVNPMTEVTRAELIEKTGIELDGPVGSENHTYYTIDMTDGTVIAEVDFTLDGVSYCQRACTKDNMFYEDLSGIYFTEPKDETVQVDYCDGTLYTGDGMCTVIWWDRVPGISYTLSCTENEDGNKLLEVAAASFIPMQGEAE